MERSQKLWFTEDAFFHEYVNMKEIEFRYFVKEKMLKIVTASC
jgi:hypothetical protein